MQKQQLGFFPTMVSILLIVPSLAWADVHALFDLSDPAKGPFPSDQFTVPDSEQQTCRRVALPMPSDCAANRSDCEDITLLNLLDGFHQHPRLSIPFDGPIDVDSVTNSSVFLIRLGSTLGDDNLRGTLIGINQIVWDTFTNSLHARSDESLDEHTRYVLIVTRGLRDQSGAPVQAADEFRRFRQTVRGEYKHALLAAIHAARRAGILEDEIVVASVFTTQSSTYLARRIHDQIFSGSAPAPADFNIGPEGTRAVYPLNQISTVTFNRQLTTGPALTPLEMDLFPVRYRLGAIDRVTFGRFESPDYMVHPGEYIPEFATRMGLPASRGANTIYFNLYLPAGQTPPGGWPVAISGHGGGGHKNFNIDSSTSIPASHGLAVIAINAVGHGQGPLSTLTITRTDGSTVTLPAGGRGRDQNGDGMIGSTEGFTTTGVRRIRDRSDAFIQTAADLMQLVRVIQAGVDVDGDGRSDLDGSRITYYGHSFGAIYGMAFVAATPEVRAAVFSAISSNTLETSSRNPGARPAVGALLAARIPSLLNSAFGPTTIDGVSIAAGPAFNENQPLRNSPPLINDIPGAIAIQEFLERSAWLGRFGDPAAFAPLLRRNPPPGVLAVQC